MRRRRCGARLAAGARALALLALASGCTVPPGSAVAPPQGHAGHAAHTQDSAGSGFQRESDAAMARMMREMHAPGYAGNVDVDFLAMMIPHHAGAVDMARLVLEHGNDPAALRKGAAADHAVEFPSLGGTRGVDGGVRLGGEKSVIPRQ